MYASNQQQQQHHHQALYNGGSVPSSSYHWEHQLRVVPNHDRITASNHPSDPHWYSTDSVLCPNVPTLPSNGHHIKNEKSHQHHQHELLYASTQSAQRVVIPSKRAAQNRAAQRAFRQRKEKYVKELERKAKLMDEWKIELDQLRQQNRELKENSMRLEKQIHKQHNHDLNQPISPITSPSLASSGVVVPPPVVVMMDSCQEQQPQQRTNKRRVIKQEPSPHKIQTTFLPVNLRAPEQTGFISSPTTSCSSSSSSIAGLEDSQQHLQQIHLNNHYHAQMSWNSNTSSSQEYDSSSYDNTNNLSFMSNSSSHSRSDQILDDLCSVLQARQRPSINTSYNSMQTSYSIRHEADNTNSTLLMSRSY